MWHKNEHKSKNEHKKTASTHPLNETPEGVEGEGNISMLFYNYMRCKNERDEYVT